MFRPTEGSSCLVWSVDPLRDAAMVIIQKPDSVLIKNCKTPTIPYMHAAETLCMWKRVRTQSVSAKWLFFL